MTENVAWIGITFRYNNTIHIDFYYVQFNSFVYLQESLAQLQELEEELVDSHKKLLGNLENWLQQDATLLTMTNDVDYDQEAYAQLLEEMVREKQEVLTNLAERARAFR